MASAGIRRLMISGLALLGMSLFTNIAWAEKIAAPLITVIDTQLILREAVAANHIRDQVDKLRENFRQEIQKEEETLRVADRELAQQKQLLAPEAYAKRRQDLQQKIAVLQRKAQDRKKQLEQGVRGAMRVFQENMLTVAAELSRERGANLVLPKSQVLLVDDMLDVTKEVLKRLNAKLTKVKVEIPKE